MQALLKTDRKICDESDGSLPEEIRHMEEWGFYGKNDESIPKESKYWLIEEYIN